MCIEFVFSIYFRALWPQMMKRRKPSEPIMENRAALEIPINHPLNMLPEDRTQPSPQSEDAKKPDHETPPDS